MSTPAKESTKKEKKKPLPVKTSMNSPYSLQWTPLENKEHKHFILNTLKIRISDAGLQKTRVSEWGNRRRSRKKTLNATEDQNAPSEPAKSNTETPKPSWTNVAARRQLAIGINEVTKGLERNELSLVLVCKSVMPEHMTSHLIPLSKTRSVPACQVPGLSESLSEPLGLKCVLALGFKRGSEVFDDVVGAIAAVVPPLTVAWIPADAEEKRTDVEKRQKRTFEEVSDEATGVSPVILQPLKVKKIIPNPTKVRKPKKKGKKS